MKIDILGQPDLDIFRDRKKYALWFIFFLLWVFIAVGIAVFAVYFDTHSYQNLDNWALGILFGASLGITWPGSKLQAYKRLYPPHREKLVELRSNHPAIEIYCAEVEATRRRLVRAEYEACIDYSEKHSAIPFLSEDLRPNGKKR
jgi:hypothetical protein